MYHSLAMHIQQPLGNAFELSGVISSAMGGVSGRSETLQAQTDSRSYVPRRTR